MIRPVDELYMKQALELSKEALGMTTPNPMVGAIVVDDDGNVVGRGYHHQAGQPHAEPNALDDAGDKARGATLYVTLEPCCTFGRTPPCTERIKRSGIRRVVIGTMDLNPKHAGAAVKILQDAGIEVESGVLEEQCTRLNEWFFWWIQKKRPFVLLKMGMTLDGRIATHGGQSQWITGSDSRNHVQELRRWADAVMVGGSTVWQDNPSLTVRIPERWPRQPRRLVWTSRPLPSDCKLLTDGGKQPELAKPVTREEWLAFLSRIGAEDVTCLLLEGGGELAANALACGIVNKVAFFVAPKILGGRGSRPVVGGEDPESLSEALELDGMEVETVGTDLLVTGYPHNIVE